MNIKIDKEYILLGQFLQIVDIASSGGESKILVKQLPIFVNDEAENRRGRKLYVNDIIQIENKKFVIV